MKKKLQYLSYLALVPVGPPIRTADELLNWVKTSVMSLLLTVASIVVFGVIIYAGFLYVTSGGNEENVKKARAALEAGVGGFLIIALSYIAIMALEYFLT